MSRLDQAAAHPTIDRKAVQVMRDALQQVAQARIIDFLTLRATMAADDFSTKSRRGVGGPTITPGGPLFAETSRTGDGG
jgi:hypothetical protein